ncbi:protocadherin-16 [Protopterus annectens]|uniref:protocadherin-16 n=1 Tax=Protopterus annectens TaxID=7888 RepID=UPI001CFB90A5|nr:protocadherin-16 [Protopterus annectens]
MDFGQNVRLRSRGMVLFLYIVWVLIPGQSSAMFGILDLQIDEEQPAGTIIGDISAGLPPGSAAGMFFISEQEGTGVTTDLDIDEKSGIIKTAKVLDRETREKYNFIAVTSDGLTVEVTIVVNDINDHAPLFPKSKVTFQIPEHTPIGTKFPLEPAFDADKDQFNTQGYIIKEGNIGQAFKLETRRGSNEVLYLDLVVNNILDREKRSSYSLVIEAFDGGSPRKSSLLTLDLAVQDINDNPPVFNQSRYHALISENLQPGSNILQVFATDADQGENGVVIYEINRRQSDPENYFVIDSKTGIIKLNKVLDYELKKVHELVVQAKDNATHPEITTAFVTIHVRDYNDNLPTMTIIFLSEDGSPQVSEGAQPGQYVARISVSDPDYGEYSNVNVSLEGGDGRFALTTKDNIIYLIIVAKLLDREERDTYELRVMATDSGTPPLRAESSFVLHVMDVNDNPPMFDQQVYRQTIPEVVYPGSFVLQVTARDKDQGPNGEIQYSILHNSETHSNWFTIDPVTGIITTVAPLDYETDPLPKLTVMATDAGKPAMSSTAVVDVVLQDVNDNEPVFSSNFYNVSLKESTPVGTCFLKVTATDADSGTFGSVVYSIGSGIASVVPTQFSIDKQTGEICSAQSLDRDEGIRSYDFTITAVDGGGLNSMAYVKVFLEDINDNRPVFYPVEYAASISTQSMPGTAIVKVIAFDKDEGRNGRVTYRIMSGNSPPLFDLNKETGVISLSLPLTDKPNTVRQLVVSAQDGGGMSSLVNARVNISIVPGSVSPPIFEQTQYFFTVPEDIRKGASVGIVRAVSSGQSDSIFYSISSGDPNGYFTIDPSSGHIRTNIPLDHEAHPVLILDIQARSGSPPAYSNVQARITVSDINDNAPIFTSLSESILVKETTEVGSTIYTVQAEDRDSGPNGQVQFDIASSGERVFSIDRTSGRIRLIRTLNYESVSRYDLKIIAKDSGVPQLSSTFTLLVHVQAENDSGPIFDTLTYRVEVKEGTAVNTRFLQVRALSQDKGATSIIYRLRADGDAASFGVIPDSGWLFVKSILDRESKDLYLLTLLACTGNGDQKKTGTATVMVTVTDENDNAPKLSEERYFVTVLENSQVGTSIGRILATDRDSGQNSKLTYRLSQPDANFQINAQTGEVATKVSLDREHQSTYILIVLVQDGGTPPRSATGTIYVTVLDENDNAPVFLHASLGRELTVQVFDGKPSGTFVASLQAKDPDEGENATVFYSITGTWAERFTIHPSSGELRTAAVLKRAERAEYHFTVTASDRGSPKMSSSMFLRIQVLGTSRYLPQPDSTAMTLNSVEGMKPGSVIGSVVSHEKLQPLNGHVTYTLIGGTDSDGTFVVDRQTGDIYLARELDYEEGAHYTLQIAADDVAKGYPTTNLIVVDIDIQDSNDHAPQFLEDPITIVIAENVEFASSVFTFQATDKDGSGPNSEIHYSLVKQAPSEGYFMLDPHSGILSLGKTIDRETTPSLLLVVQATDQAVNVTHRKSSTVTARVFVTDVNDNNPVFSSPSSVSVMEDQPTGFVVLYVIALDGDLGENGRVSYQIQSGNTKGVFSLNLNTGSLSIVKPLDREDQDVYNLTIIAADHGSPRRSAMQLLTVRVVDVNDEPPKFEKAEYEGQVMENQPAGTAVLTVLAIDRDLGSNSIVTYGGVEDGFAVDSETGTITTTRPLDREVQDKYTITVYARDSGVPPNIAKATVRISILDENDHIPTFEQESYYLDVPENHEPVTLFTLKAEDRDAEQNGLVEYEITNGDPDGHFSIDKNLGVLSTSQYLDRESVSDYYLTVTAKDGGHPQKSSTVHVSIHVLDINDNFPSFPKASYSVDVAEDAEIGTMVLALTAEDRDEESNGKVFYYLSNESMGMFTIDMDTGEITTAAPLDREKRASFSFNVIAVDSAPSDPKNSSVQVTVSIKDVNDNTPFFLQDPLVVNISKLTSVNQVVATMKAEDKDFGANASIFYRFARLVSGFSINSFTGEIRLVIPLASMSQTERTLFVVASDQGTPARSSTGVVVIYLMEESYRGVRFARSTRDVQIPENAVTGTSVASIQAEHTEGSSGKIMYSIFSGNDDGAFSIRSSTGDISVQSSSSLDFETAPKLRLVVKAEASASFSFMAVNLNLQDVNDNLPRFQLQNYVAFIREAQGYEAPIIQVLADDPDQGQNGQVTYAIQSSPTRDLFRIDSQTGAITTTAIMDREIWPKTRLVVTATDRGTPRLVGTATLTVVVMDLNDNSPTIPLPRDVHIPENALMGTEIMQVTGNDVDSGPALSYVLLLDSSYVGMFSIHRYGGRITLTEPLDFEERNLYILTILSSDSKHSTAANLTIVVEDINDNPPVFSQDLYQVSLLEHTPVGSPVVTVTATDRDSGNYGMVTYRVVSSHKDEFYIDPKNGTLFTNKIIEFDFRRPALDVVIEAVDAGTPSLSAFTTVQIQVQDVNDNAPSFHQTRYTTSVMEDILPGTTILTIEAVDEDLSRDNGGFDYTIISGNQGNVFQMESSVRLIGGRFQTVGTLILIDKLDFETVALYNLTIAASDRGMPQKSSTVQAVITVLDVNDNAPLFSSTEYNVAVSEIAPIGTEVVRVMAHDADSSANALIHYTISSGNEGGLFQISEMTGSIRLARGLDRETQAAHIVIVQAFDSQNTLSNFALVPVLIEVKDVNDNKPYFPIESLTTSIRENRPPNTLVSIINAIDSDTGIYGQLQYFIIEQPATELAGGEKKEAFTMNQTSGELRTRLTFDYERIKQFRLMAKAVDAGNFSATVTIDVLVIGEDEYDPVFLASAFHFEVPEGAKKGQSIGQVKATDEDEGPDGIILYSFVKPSPYFGINETTGLIYLRMDSQRHHSGRSKRETREMTLEIQAHSPLPASRTATTLATIDITHTSFGLIPNMNLLLVIAIAASLGVVVILAAIAIILAVVRSRRKAKKRAEAASQLTSIQGATMQKMGREESSLPSADHIYHQTLPGYSSDQSVVSGNYARGGSLDPSHSSGRGSAEAEAAEDDEIRMINEYPRVASITSSMQDHISTRGPDSGIQQDADQMSDISCDQGMDTSQWFKNKKGPVNLLLPGQHQIYRDEGGGYALGVSSGLNVSHTKEYNFPEDGKPSVDGSLTAIVASDEELRGSYNWDYLLNWCPQFQPLASVFTEIARLKDENAPRKPFQPKPKAEPKPRIDPPPLITSVAHPGAKSVPPKPAIGRTFPHLATLRRSPISHEGSISSAAMSPSFSPSLSPLAARSPAVSPFGVNQGPSASMISTEHSLDNPEEAELRI